ncbi:MAG: hypothetical protein ACJA00_005818 [Myxococcota bacterium]
MHAIEAPSDGGSAPESQANGAGQSRRFAAVSAVDRTSNSDPTGHRAVGFDYDERTLFIVLDACDESATDAAAHGNADCSRLGSCAAVYVHASTLVRRYHAGRAVNRRARL